MAAGIEVPRGEYVHGYLLMNDQKMSKSLGNVIDPFEVIDVFGADALRFYLFREVAFGQDGSVSTEGFEQRYTTELANELGNLANRTHSMIGKYRDGVVPGGASRRRARRASSTASPTRSATAMDRTEISAALEAIWRRVRALNRYVQEQEPWKLAKDPSAADRLDQVLYGLAEGLRVVGVLLLPILPEKADRLLVALGAEERSIDCARFGAVGGGATLGELEQLFPRVEREPLAQAAPWSTPTATSTPASRRTASSSRARARRASRGIATVGMNDDVDRARARRGRRARGGLRDRRPPSERGGRLRPDARPGADRARGAARARARDRRDGPRLLPRLRAARRPAARVRGADRPGARGSGCRSSSTRARPRRTRSRCCASAPAGSR